MTELQNKLLTDKELIAIVNKAPDEIECADAYKHFLESLAELVTNHFGGDVVSVSMPVDESLVQYRCDSCGKTCDGVTGEIRPIEECVDLFERLDPGSTVPHGECFDCGAFVYAVPHIDGEWIAKIAHNECVPSDGWVYNEFDPDIDWNQEEPCRDGKCTS